MILRSLKRIFMSGAPSGPAELLYAGVVSAARQPMFYTDMGVRDDLEGRFDVILLHLFLVVERLVTLDGDACGPEAAMARDLQEVMIRDMDRSLREMGVGDMSVGKKIKAMGEAWLGRQQAYQDALRSEAPEQAFADAVARNILGVDKSKDDGDEAVQQHKSGAFKLARYSLALNRKLSALQYSEITKDRLINDAHSALEEIMG